MNGNFIVTFYAKQNCIFCESMEADLVSLGVPYAKIYPQGEQLDKLKKLMPTFPMMFINDELIGGYDEFSRLLSTNVFQEKLKKFDIKCSNIF